MVTVRFRLSEVGEISLNLKQSCSLDELLSECCVRTGTQLGGFIAVRAGQVITGKTQVGEDDEIDVFPAISGG